jgi:hypothetical protein
MRTAITTALLVGLVGCASSPSLTPRQYLDETTAATLTVAAEPWIFTPAVSSNGAIAIDRRARDFLTLYAVDVNRQGDHRQYIAALHAAPPLEWSAEALPALRLRFGGEEITLSQPLANARQVGIAQPLAPSYSLASKWWFYSVDKTVLKRLASARELVADFSADGKTLDYSLWRDAGAQVAELTTVLP